MIQSFTANYIRLNSAIHHRSNSDFEKMKTRFKKYKYKLFDIWSNLFYANVIAK